MKATLLLLSLISISIATPVIISGYSTVLELYDLDTAGSLKLQHNFTVPSPLTYWAQHPTKFDVFYAVLEGVPDGLVKSFTISGGNITETSSVAVGAGPVHVTVEPQGRWLYTAGYTTGNITAVSILANGNLGAVFDTVSNGAKTHQTVIDPTGKYLFAPCVDGNLVGQWNIGADGKLTSLGNLTFPTGAGPRHLAFGPVSNTVAWVVTEVSSQIFTATNNNGVLTFGSVVPSTDSTPSFGSTVRISKDGKFLSSIAIFGIERNNFLTRVKLETAGGDINYPRDFNLNPSQTFAVVANQLSDTLTVLRRDATTGLLTKVSTTTTAVSQPVFVGFLNTVQPGTTIATSKDSSASSLFMGLFAFVLFFF
eukprot:TRINITY_DN1124_c0_g1_i3.p1 TRINITY_DN1124_c0_g1~~TRINITY_DN1124_c0_g1_i3.p1  ORF type:complete len:399 (+),score=104.07 TRINITY_DN1124_c0_g1_i3:98-1198(+)